MEPVGVIVRGLGNVGRDAIRMIATKSSIKLVGAIDINPDMVGKDAGTVCGLDPLGVTVSDDVDAVLAGSGEVVLDYSPTRRDESGRFSPSVDEICRELAAGKNVITTIPLYYMRVTAPDLYKKLDDTARAAGVTFLPSGLLPGAYASYIPMVLAGIMGRVDTVLVESGEDDQFNTSSWVKVFGYGTDPATFPSDRLKAGIVSYYVGAVYEMGERLGIPFDTVRSTHQVFAAPEDLQVAWGTVEKGTIYGHVFEMIGEVDGKPRVTLRYVHRVCADKVEEPRIREAVDIDGEPGLLHTEIHGMMPADNGYVTSAAPTVNVIPQVVAAPAGYQLAMDLPVVVPIL
ncbi:hypothetical protein [Rarobacter incanus]|uniref:Uncharacterized protein n=1 Tax=Rarobacter incanus TaxID=153494 RepID=A0A542SRN0_9MICO|nr:hypothetical protein [Rarobacter incanus]TQK76887.1 hypothetical protein FB389_1587 [Rarobacter incanus]